MMMIKLSRYIPPHDTAKSFLLVLLLNARPSPVIMTRDLRGVVQRYRVFTAYLTAAWHAFLFCLWRSRHVIKIDPAPLCYLTIMARRPHYLI